MKILKSYKETRGYVSQVRQLADENKKSFGFLPKNAYEYAASHGRLWIAVNEKGEMQGYLLFGGRHPRLKVFQIYVCDEYRGSGVGKKMIDELIKHAESRYYSTITANVATELQANRFWQHKDMGFSLIEQMPGERNRRPKNVYLLELRSSVLFMEATVEQPEITYINQPILRTASYAIDLNILLDVVKKDRDEEKVARNLLSSAMVGKVSLSVSYELQKELERHIENGNDPVLQFAKGLPTLPGLPPKVLTELTDELRGILFPGSDKTRKRGGRDESDLIHLASCIHHKAYGFITRDSRILRHADELKEKFNLEIASPIDLYDPFDEEEFSRRQTIEVESERRQIKASNLQEEERLSAEKFLKTFQIPNQQALSCLDSGTTVFPRKRLVFYSGEEIVGVGSWDKNAKANQNSIVVYLYVDEKHPESEKAIDYLLGAAMESSIYGKLARLDLQCADKQLKTRETAVQRGFRFREGMSLSLSKLTFKGVVTKSNWNQFKRQFEKESGLVVITDVMPDHKELQNTGVTWKRQSSQSLSTTSLFSFETLISPGSLIAPGRDGAIVPIKEQYADQLINSVRTQATFLPDPEAVLRLERAYFLDASKQKLLSPGKIIVFYVSGSKLGGKQAVGLARVTFVDTLTKRQAVIRLGRQGVLTEEQIKQRANKSGEIAAFTFDNFLQFHNPVSYKDLKKIGCGKANFVTIETLPSKKLLEIVKKAF